MFGVALLLASIVHASHAYEDRRNIGLQSHGEDNLATLLLAMNPTIAQRSRGQSFATLPRVEMPQMGADMKLIKQLNQATGVGLMDCKEALDAAGGDMEEAKKALRKKGLASAEKRSGRATSAGAIVPYIHTGGLLGIMVEVNCETDFVGSNKDFVDFGLDIAMQLAAYPDVEYIDEDDVDPAWVEKERAIISESEDLAGKPDDIKAKMIDGRVQKLIKTKTLMDKEYIKDTTITIKQLVDTMKTKFGENIKVVRFARFVVGETNK
jgi:elongation factor Ts